MCNSATKLFAEAERCYVVGDQERSYVLFGKYFKTILPLKQRDDYRRNKMELDLILGPQSKQMRGIEMMTELRDSLVGRYKLTNKMNTIVDAKDSSVRAPSNVIVPTDTPSSSNEQQIGKSMRLGGEKCY